MGARALNLSYRNRELFYLAVVGVLTGTEGTKLRVAAGDYNTQIDQRIAAIKSTCRVP